METFIRDGGASNIGPIDRFISVVSGSALIIRGLQRGSKDGLAVAAVGAELLRRGATGHSYLYQALGLSSVPREKRRAVIPYRQGIRVDEAVTINKPAAELYQFWRHLENLPNFMDHLSSVRVIDDRRSHWIAKAPAGRHAEWDAEIISDIPGEMISWRSLEGSEIGTAGSVHFQKAPSDRGTEVRVELQYDPPGGIIAALFAKLFGEEPEQQVREDLRHFKQIMEAGEIPTTRGQPTGPRITESQRYLESLRRQAEVRRRVERAA